MVAAIAIILGMIDDFPAENPAGNHKIKTTLDAPSELTSRMITTVARRRQSVGRPQQQPHYYRRPRSAHLRLFSKKPERNLDQKQLAPAWRHKEGEGRFLSAGAMSAIGGNSEASAWGEFFAV
jgi:hypothetical protein